MTWETLGIGSAPLFRVPCIGALCNCEEGSPSVGNLRALPLLYGMRNRLSDGPNISPRFDDPLILQSHDLVIVIGNCSLSSNILGASGAQ